MKRESEERKVGGLENSQLLDKAMGRLPCCDKVGIKKGPWTPEEDIILVSYIQEHGPGNWRSVPTNTGLLRCSKSCRLRWTNYLRPGIKRGNFTQQEEGMIIHLQALLGNKWAAIASYLPQRTDNDIKNFWNTHLKKKLKKFQSDLDPISIPQDSSPPTSHFLTKNTHPLIEKRSLDFTPTSSTYASNTENISRLLEGWMRSSPKPIDNNNKNTTSNIESNDHPLVGTSSTIQCNRPKAEQVESGEVDLISHDEFETILSFENLNNVSWDKSSTCESNAIKGVGENCASDEKDNDFPEVSDQKQLKCENNTPPLSFLEKWLLDENSTAHVEEAIELSSIF